MVRPYAIKGYKMKKSERYDKEEEADGSFEIEYGIPIPPPQSQQSKPKPQTGVIFVLERASLEVGKVGKALLAILDSPLNKAGRLKGLYVRTEKGVLIEVKPRTHLPRTSKRFYGLMSQLLQRLSIKNEKTHAKLLRVIKNPVTQYLPINSHKIGFSFSSEKLIKMKDYVHNFENDRDIVFVVGAMAHGKIEPDYVDDFIAVSNYPLSAARCTTTICHSLEEK
ncbi:ribosomal RNA small subunit methyltransferase NEP1-like isoform X2 [Humulus lupulus]|uniref:ribosomal RNA small subunit methyltransferase NEP1-like isoform X2 n=1 Tax=Humulus lupulus TaxID=3486 RepID=UPI002B404D51|nr:ribosomal RNA small subunit methyltransferase NEP1-like isoform X2 [Humulus lupulus]